MSRNNYATINKVGQHYYSEVSNPLTYCINDTLSQRFLHGGNTGMYGQSSKQCQSFLSDYCAQGWDSVCEIASKNINIIYPNSLPNASIGGVPYMLGAMSAGDMLIRNTASVKYVIALGNCQLKYEPFDPTVADSPMIRYWVSNTGNNSCTPVYGVSTNPEELDSDILMDKILQNPKIALDILINIYNNHKRYDLLTPIKDTKLGRFFSANPQIFK